MSSSLMSKSKKERFKKEMDFSYQLDEAEFSHARWDNRRANNKALVESPAIAIPAKAAGVPAVIPSELVTDKKLNEGGNANVPLTSLLKLMQDASDNLSDPAPSKFLVSASSYKIFTEKGFARFTMKFLLRILEDGWVSIPLLTHRAAVVTSTVTRTDQKDAMASPTKTWSFCVLPTTDPASNSTQGLLSNVSGDYVVEIEALVPYANLRETGLLLSVPKSVIGDLQLEVQGTALDIKVEPALSCEFTEENHRSRIRCKLPPTNRLMIQWTEKLVELDSEPAVKEQLALTISAEQYVLHSIGEGVLSSKVVLKYIIQNGSVSLFEIVIDSRVRLVNVVGTGLKRWEVVEQEAKEVGEPKSDKPLGPSDDPPKKGKRPNRILKAYMDYGMEDSYELTITTELAMGDTSARVVVPTQRSLGVTREKGHVGLEARTNVELQETQARGLAMTDVGELPSDVTTLATNAVLLGYKYLDPTFLLEVDVKKHSDVPVLIAIVEKCNLDITFTAEGSMLSRLTALVKNTQKQFIRIKLPEKSTIWSTSSAGQPVKPAFDEKEKALMVPLQKTKLGDSSNGGSFKIEVIYLQDMLPMGDRGRITVVCPTLDLPANYMKVLLKVPGDYRYGEFTGDMKETRNRYLEEFQQTGQFRAAHMNTNPMYSNVQVARNDVLEDNVDDTFLDVNEHAGGYNKVKGVRPVEIEKVNMPNAMLFAFDRSLLGSETKLEVTASYRRTQTKGCCSRRRVDGCTLL